MLLLISRWCLPVHVLADKSLFTGTPISHIDIHRQLQPKGPTWTTNSNYRILNQGEGANCPQEIIGYICHIFALKTSDMISWDSRGTRAAPNRVHDQPWSFIWPLQGPLKGPCDFLDSARLFLPFLKSTFSKPSEYHGTHLWSLLYFTKPQGILMDLHGPPNGP